MSRGELFHAHSVEMEALMGALGMKLGEGICSFDLKVDSRKFTMLEIVKEVKMPDDAGYDQLKHLKDQFVMIPKSQFGSVWIDEKGVPYGTVSDEQIESVLTAALHNLRNRNGWERAE